MLWLWVTVFRLLLVLSELPYCQAYRRIMGMSITGQPIVNRDFQYTYYYLKKNYIARKNSAFAQNPAVLATPDFCQLLTVDPRRRSIINTLDVIVQPTPA